MSIADLAQRAAKAVLPPLLFMGLTAYFGWNALRGDHGLRAYAVDQKELVKAQTELAGAIAERDAWETRVSGLRTNHIDPDTLDERARAMLNLAEPGDIVVPYGPSNKLF